MATITITDSASTNAFLLPDELGSELTIGTAESCSIPLPAVEGLSSCHCRIVRLDDGYALSDAGSENGTYADDRPVESEYMVPGVLYRIGAATMVYDDGGHSDSPSAEHEAAPVSKKVQRRKPSSGLSAAELRAAAQKYKRDQQVRQMTMIYVVLVIVAAFYAGMALYSWKSTGNPLPIFLR